MTLNELRKVENTMTNYKLQIKLYGCATVFEDVHIGIKGNHADVVTQLMNNKYGNSWQFVSIAKKQGKFSFGVGRDYPGSKG